MSDGSITFIIPVRHQDSVADWSAVVRYLQSTLESICGQTSDNWRCIVVANRGAQLPELPPKCELIFVDLPVPVMPDPATDQLGFYNAIRKDKGLRLLAGLQHGRPRGHVMMADSDDWVSPQIAALVASQPNANGWFFDQGYLYSGGPLVYLYPRQFFLFCGTSHIIRADLVLQNAGVDRDYDLTAVMMRLGSHIFIKRYLDDEGTPLAPLPFIGTTYRVGHSTSGIRSKALLQYIFPIPHAIFHPKQTLRRIFQLRLAQLTKFGRLLLSESRIT